MKYLKQHLFPIFITFLGLFTAYIFYALWHSEEINPLPVIKNSTHENVIEDLSNKNIIPKSLLVVPEASLDKHSQEEDEKGMLKMMEKDEDIPNLTLNQMEAQTQRVYDSLTPKDHEESMQEAEAVFESLDTYVEELDAKLGEEMKRVEVFYEGMDTSIQEDNTQDY